MIELRILVRERTPYEVENDVFGIAYHVKSHRPGAGPMTVASKVAEFQFRDSEDYDRNFNERWTTIPVVFE